MTDNNEPFDVSYLTREQQVAERAAEAAALAHAAEEQREYERKRALLMDEAVLIATLLRQRLCNYPGQYIVTGDGMLAVVAALYGALAANAREDL